MSSKAWSANRRYWPAAVLAAGVLTSPAVAEVHETVEPPHSIVRTVSVGSVLFEKERFDAVSGAIPAGPVIRRTITGNIEIAARTPLFEVESRTKFKACAQGSGTCALDDDGDGTFDRVALSDVVAALKLKVSVPYSRRLLRTGSPSDFRQQIIFLGASQATLRLGYRESIGDMVRPAFSEEYSFPLKPTFPQTIAVKGTRIRLLGLDGLGLEYIVEREDAARDLNVAPLPGR